MKILMLFLVISEWPIWTSINFNRNFFQKERSLPAISFRACKTQRTFIRGWTLLLQRRTSQLKPELSLAESPWIVWPMSWTLNSAKKWSMITKNASSSWGEAWAKAIWTMCLTPRFPIAISLLARRVASVAKKNSVDQGLTRAEKAQKVDCPSI